MTLRYKRRYQPRLRRTWLLSPYHRIGHSGIVVLAGFGFTGIELGDWITHRSQHYASYDDFFTTVDLWESTDREIVALRLLPYREYAAVRIDRLGGKSSISGLAEWIIQFCEDPPRYYGKFVTGPVSRRYLSEHALVLASWMDALFRSNAPDLAAQLRSALILLANGEIGSPQLETATKEALIALGEFSVEAPSDVVHMIGSGPKAEFGLSSGWAFANCRLLGRSRAPIANPHLQGSRPERTRRGRIATPETNGFQSLIINARREYGLDRLSTLRSPLSKAFTAETPEDFASAVSLSFEHAFEELSSSGIPKRVLQRRLMDLGGLVRAVIGAVSERFDRIPALRAIDYAAYLLSNQLTLSLIHI